MATAAKAVTAIGDPSNDAASIISLELPYIAEVRAKGVCPLLFHRWSVDGIEAKAKAAKGSKAKREDDLESYVYRNEAGEICIPGEYFRMAAINTAKFKQDPRSPRKSAMDLFKAAIFPLEELCSLGIKEWDYVDRRRAPVQRQGITRARPAIKAGWEATVFLQCTLPEYVSPDLLNEVLQLAGRVNGIADHRPTFGRFQVIGFKVSNF